MGAKMKYKEITAKKVKVNDSKGYEVDRYLLGLFKYIWSQ